ncbi:uncharacterized protein J4E84_010667 [Alternaria hordeiaustralica]|uniref:uncharacterized protein n=1 Tax=Alternaria hordeiaustralica TaxID=1187925 RepID=UPI0020C2915B|nr:uncharacterized protein J4E84_010667 [Alternaria hordeiaustralica]KAI4674292.1 hypothetical protein J4E84_010667 [Alternaria hordeiaustralica]
MTSKATPSNGLSLRFEAKELDINDKFQLNRKQRLSLGHLTFTTPETERSITLFCNGLAVAGRGRNTVLQALRSGLFELVQSGREDAGVIKLPSFTSSRKGRYKIPSTAFPQYREVSISVLTETTHVVWKEILQPGRTYGLRLSEKAGDVFACYTDELDGNPESLTSAQKLPVHREGGDTYYFTVHGDPAPPRLFARLELPSKAYLNGPTPFTLVIEYTTNSVEPLVFDKSRSPLSVTNFCSGFDLHCIDQLIDCQDNATGEKVEWGAVFVCWDGDPHPNFPDDDDFVEISAEKPWRFECTLEQLGNEKEYVRSMEGLKAGRTYKARVNGPGGFSRWQYGKKEELLAGTREEKMKRWEVDMERLGCLDVERIEEDVYFETVA